MGTRPSAGVKVTVADTSTLIGGSDSQREKVRPEKLWSQM